MSGGHAKSHTSLAGGAQQLPGADVVLGLSVRAHVIALQMHASAPWTI